MSRPEYVESAASRNHISLARGGCTFAVNPIVGGGKYLQPRKGSQKSLWSKVSSSSHFATASGLSAKSMKRCANRIKDAARKHFLWMMGVIAPQSHMIIAAADNLLTIFTS